jgi:hypothetical protein
MNPRKFNKPMRIDKMTGEAKRISQLINAMDGKAPIDPRVSGIHTAIGLSSVAMFHKNYNRVRRGMKREVAVSAIAAVDSMTKSKTKVLKPPGK